MGFDVTNDEYVELVTGILDELAPDKPVAVRIVAVTDTRTKRKSQKMALALDEERGPQTQVLFNFSDVLGLGELQLRSFITSKLVSIGVHPSSVRDEVVSRITDEVKAEPTAAEAAKLRELLAKRKQPAVAPAVKAAESLQVTESGGFFGGNPDADGDVMMGETDGGAS